MTSFFYFSRRKCSMFVLGVFLNSHECKFLVAYRTGSLLTLLTQIVASCVIKYTQTYTGFKSNNQTRWVIIQQFYTRFLYFTPNRTQPVAKFIVPDWGIKLTPAMGCRVGPPRLHRLAGRYDNPMAESTVSPKSGTMDFATC